MQLSDTIMMLGRSTLLLVAGLVALWLCRKSTPSVRHMICLAVIGGSLLIPFSILLPEPSVIIHVASIGASLETARTDAAWWPWAKIVLAMWGCGCALVILRFLTGCFILGNVRRCATAIAPSIFLADVSVPMLTGVLRPVVLLPRAAAGWPESQRDAAIRHELAHLRRGDLRANALTALACAVYWFHPLMWILSRRLRIEQEAACDDLVLENGFDRVEYAEALVASARGARGYLLPSCPMADGPSGVKARVARILASGRPVASPAVSPKIIFAGLTIALISVSAIGAERIYSAGPGVTNPSISYKTEPQYTAAAKAAKIHGNVLVNLIVGADGAARDVVIVKGIDSELDRSAVESVRGWRFNPAIRAGKPVAMRVRIAVNFRLL